MILLFLKQRSVGSTSSVVLTFLVGAECVPCGGPENILLRHVVHTNGDAEHRAERDEVGTDVTVADRAMVGTPVIHDLVSILKRRALLAVATRCEPRAGPSVVGSLPQGIGDLVGRSTVQPSAIWSTCPPAGLEPATTCINTPT